MKTVLLIDADLGYLDTVRLALEHNGFQVTALSDARQVASQIRTQVPDLIILDVRLSGADGRSICQLLKNSPNYRLIPIILMSGADISNEDLMICEANEFLPKPFDLPVLLVKVERLLYPEQAAIALAI